MRKILLSFLLFLCTLNIAIAKDIFSGYTHDGKERYIKWKDFSYTTTELVSNPDQIAKLAKDCLNDKYWYKAEHISVKSKGDFSNYKFKFHWVLSSRIVIVDVDNGRASCREG